jgi:hypothetical protein
MKSGDNPVPSLIFEAAEKAIWQVKTKHRNESGYNYPPRYSFIQTFLYI